MSLINQTLCCYFSTIQQICFDNYGAWPLVLLFFVIHHALKKGNFCVFEKLWSFADSHHHAAKCVNSGGPNVRLF